MPLVLLIQPDISLVQPQAAAYISKVVQESSLKSDSGILIVVTPEHVLVLLLDSQ